MHRTIMIRWFSYASAIILNVQFIVCIPPSVYQIPTVGHAAAFVQSTLPVEYYDPNPSYEFKYGVNDPSTGDYKSQEESLKDGVVLGKYSLAEPDGTLRIVSYTADKESGFQAVVEKQGTAVHTSDSKQTESESESFSVRSIAVAPLSSSYQRDSLYR